MMLAAWLNSLETPEGNPSDLQRDDAAGSVGRLLVWTAWIPHNTEQVHINTATTKVLLYYITPNLGCCKVDPEVGMKNMERLESQAKLVLKLCICDSTSPDLVS